MSKMDNTKDFIIEEAFKLFLNHSYEAVSISDISQAIGFTKGALYHHFKNKEDLFKEVIDKYLYIPGVNVDVDTISFYDYIQLSMAEADKIIKSIFNNSLTFTPINYFSLFTDAFRHYPGYAKDKASYINTEIEKTKIVLENAIKSGEIRNDIDPSLMATHYFSMNMGLAGNLLTSNSVDDSVGLMKKQSFEFYKLLKKQ
jgi:AcrR family transcriptional regulator